MSNYITDIDILDESKDNFLTYSEEVLTDRAIPSAEDGLLSVHRKLIWTMENILKMSNKSKYKKSASVVGSTLASSYFHGDTACYGALCKLAQEYLMRYPLVDGDGNLGTQEGNGMEAAARYTNAKPSKYADLMYVDYNKDVVPLKPTYNEEYMEPVVLPSIFPNAICNGRQAIGISMAHNSLPHNLSEVCDAIVAYLKNNNITVEELLKVMPGPDFPLGGTVINSKDIATAYKTGHSAVSLKVRGDYEIKGQDIIFTTIPYRTYRNKIKEQINKNVDELSKYIDDFRDESNVGQNKLVFHCIKGNNPENVVNKIFALTDLQTTVSYNMNFIINGTPKLCSMKQLIEAYVNHQMQVIIAAAKYDKEKADDRKHVLDGLLIALGDIDKAIELIRASKDKNEAEVKLTGYFAIDNIQAKAILNMRLSTLTKLDKQELEKELKEKIAIIKECIKICEDKEYRTQVLITKIEKMKSKYGDARRTKLQNIELPKEDKEIAAVAPEDCVVVMTQTGLIKRIAKSSFKVQHRNGKGIKNKDDILLDVVSTNTIDTLLLFSNKGKMYRILVDNIPAGTNVTKGTNINSLTSLDMDEKIIAITSLYRKTDAEYVVFVTQNGIIKKTKIEEYTKTKRGKGMVAIKLKEGDSIQSVTFLKDEELILVTKCGNAIRFDSQEVKPQGRVTIGVKGIELREKDYVVAVIPVHKKTDDLLVVCENGLGKRISLKEIPKHKRGIIGANISGGQAVASAVLVEDKDNLILVGKPNSICISAKAISSYKKGAKGVSLIKDSKVIACVKL